MNIVWTVVTALSLLTLTFTHPQSVLTVCLDSCSQAVTATLGLAGIYCLWMGIFEVADKCRLVEGLSRCFEKLNKWLYGNVSKVPSAIAAIGEMEHGEKLSRSGAMLFVINASSVQLIPTTVMGLRASLGSADPADILLPNLIATAVTSVVGVALVFCAYGVAK